MSRLRSPMVLGAVAGVAVALLLLLGVLITLPLARDPRAIAPSSPGATLRSFGSLWPGPSASPISGPVVGLDVGQLAPDFELAKTDGGRLRLSELRGHPVWLNFWAPWCPACRTEMPRLERVWLEHQEQGLVVLGVGVRDSEDAFRSFASQVRVRYPLVMDLDGKVAQRFRALALPVHYWLDRDGVVRGWAFGELPPEVMAASLERILPSPAPTR